MQISTHVSDTFRTTHLYSTGFYWDVINKKTLPCRKQNTWRRYCKRKGIRKTTTKFSVFWLLELAVHRLPSQQILVPRTSPSNVPRMSPRDLILPSRERPDLTSQGPANLTPRGLSGDVLIWRSRDIPERLIRDVPNFFFFSFGTYSIDQIFLKAIQYSRCV